MIHFVLSKQGVEVFCFQRVIFVAGLREEIVNDAEQVLKLMASGEGLKLH